MNLTVKNLHRAFLVSSVLLVLSSAVSYFAIKHSNNKAEWVHHTELIISKLESLISNIKDAETGVRGFLITGKPETLEPYQGAYKRTISAYDTIKILTADNKAQQQDLNPLLQSIKNRFKALDNQIISKKQPGTESIEALLEGKKMMDEIRAVVKRMQERERVLLKLRSAQWDYLSSITPFLIVAIALIGLIVSYYFCRTLKIAFYNKAILQRELQVQNIETGERIKAIEAIADQIAAGDYETRVPEEKSDLLGSLAFSLNKMALSLQYSFDSLNQLMVKKDDFISIAAHELKTPLTSIKAYLQFIGRSKLDSEESKKIFPFVSKANDQVNRLTTIIKDLLDVARINEGQLGLKLENFSLRSAILEVSDELFTSIKTHELILEGNPDIEVEADKLRIEQVLINLISNGIKYSPEGRQIILKVRLFGEDRVKVSVKDFGIGIPTEKQPLVFERYFRVEESSQKYSGMGLGLYITKGIVEKHGGTMGVHSTPGDGSTFYFIIPIKQDS